MFCVFALFGTLDFQAASRQSGKGVFWQCIGICLRCFIFVLLEYYHFFLSTNGLNAVPRVSIPPFNSWSSRNIGVSGTPKYFEYLIKTNLTIIYNQIIWHTSYKFHSIIHLFCSIFEFWLSYFFWSCKSLCFRNLLSFKLPVRKIVDSAFPYMFVAPQV